MENLIHALNIFMKYEENQSWPTGCEHDVLYVYVDPDKVSEPDIKKLEELGFDVDEELGCFRSFVYGSA